MNRAQWRALLLSALLADCMGASVGQEPKLKPMAVETMTRSGETAEALTAVSGRFTPPPGQALLFIGQDTASIDDYVNAVGEVPAGVTNYTSVEQLEGLHKTADYGSGPHNLDYLAQTYPRSTLAVGLSLVNFLPQIAGGKADGNIDKLLEGLAAYDRPVYLRVGYEFDGAWNHYDPTLYVTAWRRIHDRMQHKGVDNVALVWQSATFCGGTHEGHAIEVWYPGDAYVDWVGLSYFVQAADCDKAPIEALLAFARAHQKPVMIAESTPQRYKNSALNFSRDGSAFVEKSAAEIWHEWYDPYFQFVHDNRDIVRAVAYINANWDEQPMWSKPYRSGYWGDSRVQANEIIKANWTAEIAQEFWLGAGPDLFGTLGYEPNAR